MPARPRRRSPGPDAVGMLIADLGRPGVPTAAEERAFAARIKAGGEDGRAARDEFVARNVPLVIGIAREFHARPRFARHTLGEVISFGCDGLMTAVGRFDPAFGTRFGTYATWWIRQAIRRHDLSDGLVRVPVFIRDILRSGEVPARGSVAARGRLSASLEAARRALAVRAGGAMADSTSWSLPDPEPGPAEAAAEADERDRLRGWLAELGREDPRLATVLELRFGLGDVGPLTLEQTGRHVGGVTREAVRKMEMRAMDRLRRLAGVAAGPDDAAERRRLRYRTPERRLANAAYARTERARLSWRRNRARRALRAATDPDRVAELEARLAGLERELAGARAGVEIEGNRQRKGA